MNLKIMKFKNVNSTNDIAIKLIQKGKLFSGLVVSKKQKKGRGTMGKKWISIKGNLFLSIFFKINKKMNLKKITKLNLNIINKIINEYSLIKTSIKQPNDILINGQKVCGILQEMIFNKNQKYIVIGIGINLINSPFIRNYPTTFLNKYSKKNVYKITLAIKIKNEFEKQYYKFIN